MAFQSTPMKVSKTVKVNGKNERQEVGTVSINIPLMDEILKFAATAKQAEGTDDKGKPTGKPAVDDDGLPVYDTEEANWILGAVAAAVRMQARNKLEPGSIQLKEGQTIPTDWAGLVAEGTRNTGAALAAMRECIADFTKYVATLGKKESTAQTIVTLFKNNPALESQSTEMKGKIQKYVEDFAATLSEEQVDRYDRTLTKVLETCQAATPDTDDL